MLPKLLPLGRKRALLFTGLVWATWHLPLIYLTPLLPIGNPVIAVPLFYAAVVAGSFFYGYLRLASGSLWPSSIAHATHNSAWGIMVGFTATSSPLLVNGYLLGDFGIVITVAAAGLSRPTEVMCGPYLPDWAMARLLGPPGMAAPCQESVDESRDQLMGDRPA